MSHIQSIENRENSLVIIYSDERKDEINYKYFIDQFTKELKESIIELEKQFEDWKAQNKATSAPALKVAFKIKSQRKSLEDISRITIKVMQSAGQIDFPNSSKLFTKCFQNILNGDLKKASLALKKASIDKEADDQRAQLFLLRARLLRVQSKSKGISENYESSCSAAVWSDNCSEAAEFFTDLQQIEKAKAHFLLAIENSSDTEKMSLYQELAFLQLTQKERRDAAAAFEQAVELGRSLCTKNPKDLTYQEELAKSLNNWGNCIPTEDEEAKSARSILTEALDIRRKLLTKEPNSKEFQNAVAMSLGNLGNVLMQVDFGESEKCLLESIEIYKKLGKKDPDRKADLANTLNTLATAYALNDAEHEAMNIAWKAMAIYQELAKKNPAKYLARVGSSAVTAAMAEAKIDRWDDAEDLFNTAEKAYAEVVKNQPLPYLDEMVNVFHNRAAMFQDRDDQAYQYYGSKREDYSSEIEEGHKECLKIYRKLTAINPEYYHNKIALRLGTLADLWHVEGHAKKTASYRKKAAKVWKKLAMKNPDEFQEIYASALQETAQALSKNQELDLAIEIQNEAIHAFEKMHKEGKEGMAVELVEAMSSKSELLAAMGKIEEAKKLKNEKLEFLRSLGADKPEYLAALAKDFSEKAQEAISSQDLKEAISLWEKSLLHFEKAHAINQGYSGDIANTNLYLGTYYKEAEMKKEAISAFKTAITILNPMSFEMPHLRQYIARALHELGQLGENVQEVLTELNVHGTYSIPS